MFRYVWIGRAPRIRLNSAPWRCSDVEALALHGQFDRFHGRQIAPID